MIRNILLILIMILFSACGSKPEYVWKGESKVYLNKYKQMMLKGDVFQASYYLRDAKKESRNDFSLRTQSIIALTECAMNFALGQAAPCTEYEKYRTVLKDDALDAFYHLITLKDVKNIKLLGRYEDIYQAIKINDVKKGQWESFETIASLSIAARLVYENKMMTKVLAREMILRASKANVNALMKVWIEILKEFSTQDELEKLNEKIKLLRGNS